MGSREAARTEAADVMISGEKAKSEVTVTFAENGRQDVPSHSKEEPLQSCRPSGQFQDRFGRPRASASAREVKSKRRDPAVAAERMSGPQREPAEEARGQGGAAEAAEDEPRPGDRERPDGVGATRPLQVGAGRELRGSESRSRSARTQTA